MKLFARIAGAIALAGTILPAALYLGGSMELERVKTVMLISTIVWFIAAPLADRQTKGEKIVEDAAQQVVP